MKFLTQKSTAFLLLALSAATGLLLLTFSHNLMYYWLFGLGFGIILVLEAPVIRLNRKKKASQPFGCGASGNQSSFSHSFRLS